jgi:uncharacterized membrane protein
MDSVQSVEQLDGTHLHWVAEIAGKRHEWDAEITCQDPAEHIAWRSTDGKTNSGSVQFTTPAEGRTTMRVRMTWQAEGAAETVGEKTGVDERGVKADLERFKVLVEGREAETGARRGEVRAGEVSS